LITFSWLVPFLLCSSGSAENIERHWMSQSRGVYGDGDDENLRIFRGYGYECYGNTAGMDLTIARFLRGWILLRRELHGNGQQTLLSAGPEYQENFLSLQV